MARRKTIVFDGTTPKKKNGTTEPQHSADEGSHRKKGLAAVSEFLSEHKKQVTYLAIALAATFVICAGAGFARNTFHSMAAAADSDYADLQNEMDQFRNSDPYFTHQREVDKQDEVRIEWVGTKVDTGRWTSDENVFWEFIRPAFNFSNGMEYNQTREDYISKLGNCLFTTQFLTYYDIGTIAKNRCDPSQLDPVTGEAPQYVLDAVSEDYKCTASKSDYITYPIAENSDGSYTYLAIVFMTRNESREAIGVAFTFTAEHSIGADGADTVNIRDFACWPPDSRRTYRK